MGDDTSFLCKKAIYLRLDVSNLVLFFYFGLQDCGAKVPDPTLSGGS